LAAVAASYTSPLAGEVGAKRREGGCRGAAQSENHAQRRVGGGQTVRPVGARKLPEPDAERRKGFGTKPLMHKVPISLPLQCLTTAASNPDRTPVTRGRMR